MKVKETGFRHFDVIDENENVVKTFDSNLYKKYRDENGWEVTEGYSHNQLEALAKNYCLESKEGADEK